MSMSSNLESPQPPLERPRVESDSVGQLQASFTQDADFWYEDGNIIIVAQEVGFRIYKGFLASRSEVFRDMISLAQPVLDSSCEGTLDGCPYVHVSDTAAEIRSLLRILFIGRQYMRRTDLEFDDMANCIRLAHKYDIPDLLEDALEKLEGYYPESDPDSWDTVCGDGPSTRAIVALNLAHLTDTPSIFPAAMYDCCNLDGQTILAGRIHSDGAADFLSLVDLARCIDGKARLCSRNSQVIREVLAPLNNANCSAPDNQCNANIASMLSDRLWDATTLTCSNIFAPWDDIFHAHYRKTKPKPDLLLCSSCIAALCRRAKTVRNDLFLEIPKLLGLVEQPVKESQDGSSSYGDD